MDNSRGFSMSDVDNISAQLSEVKEDMREMRTSMKIIADAVTRLAVLESKNKTQDEKVEALSIRVREVERQCAETQVDLIKITSELRGSAKTIKILWGVFGAAILTGIYEVFVKRG